MHIRKCLIGTIGMLGTVFAGPFAHAQTWQTNVGDSGALYYGGVFAPQGSTAFSCTAPSPQGLALINTGDHEANRTDDPYGMIITFSAALLDPFTEDADRAGFSIQLDGQAYALPVVHYSDFYGEWTARPFYMGDPIFTALAQAQEMIVDPGLGTAYAYPVDGLADGLRAVIGHCISGWEQAGHSVPQQLESWRQAAPQVAPVAPGWTLGQVQDLADAACDSAALIEADNLILEDFDGDGQTDLVLDWGNVTCPYADPAMRRGAGVCGASACSIDFHMTTQSAPELGLGLGAFVDVDEQGRRLTGIGGSLSECASVGMDNCYFRYDLSNGTPQRLGPVAR